MKPIKCWYCAYLRNCMDYNENGCEKFIKWRLTIKEVADLCKVNERTIYRWLTKSIPKTLRTIYHLTGYKFKAIYDESRMYLVRIIDEEKNK